MSSDDSYSASSTQPPDEHQNPLVRPIENQDQTEPHSPGDSLVNDSALAQAGNSDSNDDTALPSPKKIRGWHRGLLLVIFLAVIGYSVGLPILLDALSGPDVPLTLKPSRMPLDQAIHLHSMKAFAVIWVLCLGSTVGSFLNVVVYRMPRGKSVVFTPSRCPKCNSNIRPTDNIPIFGWLKLEGKCRSCRSPISARYPVVESLVALLFLTVFGFELVSGGVNIPMRAANLYHGIVWILFELRWDLIRFYLFHCALVCIAVSWILIDIDRQTATWLAIVVCIATLIVPTLIWPHLQPISVFPELTTYPQSIFGATMTSIVGGIAGLLLGLALATIFPASQVSQHTECTSQSHSTTRSELTDQESKQDCNPAEQLNTIETTVADETLTATELATVAACAPLEVPIAAIDPSQEIESTESQTDSHHSVESSETLSKVRDYGIVPSSRNLISLLIFVGLAVGWQSTLIVVALALALRIVAWLPMSLTSYRLPLSLFVGLAALMLLALWKPLFLLSRQTWFGSTVDSSIAVLVFVGLCIINKLFSIPVRTQ